MKVYKKNGKTTDFCCLACIYKNNYNYKLRHDSQHNVISDFTDVTIILSTITTIKTPS